MKTRSAFSRCHPAVLLLYYAVVVLITVASQDMTILFLSTVGALLMNIAAFAKGIKKDLAYIFILFFLITVTNPLFSRNGITVLFFIGDTAYTLEALLYGLDTAVMISGVILWMRCFGKTVTDDKMQYIFSRTFPKITLIITMVLRFIPLYRRRIKDITDAQRALGIYDNKSIKNKIRNASRVFLSLVTQSLESSVETAYSMKARGYGEGKRTSMLTYKIKPCDIVLTVFLIIFTVYTICFATTDRQSIVFYPAISFPQLTVKRLIVYILFGTVVLIPFATEITESIRWKYYQSKI